MKPVYVYRELLKHWVASFLPKWLVYYASIRLVSKVTTGKYSNIIVPELSAMDAIKRFGNESGV